jgi:hypothetical protein
MGLHDLPRTRKKKKTDNKKKRERERERERQMCLIQLYISVVSVFFPLTIASMFQMNKLSNRNHRYRRHGLTEVKLIKKKKKKSIAASACSPSEKEQTKNIARQQTKRK